MKKKGSLPFALGLILLLICAIVVFLFTQGIFNVGQDVIGSGGCVSSLVASGYKGSIDCPRRYISFWDHQIHVRAGGKDSQLKIRMLKDGSIVKSDTYDALTDDIVYQAIAEEMMTCWDNVAAGTVNVLKQESGSMCLVCSQITFDDSSHQSRSGLLKYLKTTKTSSSKTYYDSLLKKYDPKDVENFVVGASGPQYLSNFDYFTDESLDFQKTYMLVLQDTKKSSTSNKVDLYFFYLKPIEYFEDPNLCTHIVN